ncbi:MAG: response regulator [Flavobacterium sp.]|jgi:two-component system, chemotaxis family, chemotaxis protein CheY|nr:response regulator [Flavobacterium sp.]MDP5026779.1 response regulator [Flavobacterium sp.]MDP5096377.1 response regulator [Flavobacterium sp.]
MKKILIIDDEVNLRETIAEMLIYVGYEVFLAQDGAEGLQKTKEIIPDVIICDVMMPNTDGYGFMEQHIISEYAHIPVLLLSAKVEQKDEEYGLSLGVKAYIRKPFTFKELVGKIELYLSRS